MADRERCRIDRVPRCAGRWHTISPDPAWNEDKMRESGSAFFLIARAFIIDRGQRTAGHPDSVRLEEVGARRRWMLWTALIGGVPEVQ